MSRRQPDTTPLPRPRHDVCFARHAPLTSANDLMVSSATPSNESAQVSALRGRWCKLLVKDRRPAVRLACRSPCRFQMVQRPPFRVTFGKPDGPAFRDGEHDAAHVRDLWGVDGERREPPVHVIERADLRAFRRGVGGTQILPAGYDRTRGQVTSRRSGTYRRSYTPACVRAAVAGPAVWPSG
jgi:hypothetical protein